MKLTEQVAETIIKDKKFRRGLSGVLDRHEDHLRREAKDNKANSCLTLGAALEYYKANGFKSPTIRETPKNLQTV